MPACATLEHREAAKMLVNLSDEIVVLAMRGVEEESPFLSGGTVLR